MLTLTRLPVKIAYFLRGTQDFFRYRHHLVFSWTLILIVAYSDKATLCGLARLGPKHICEWHIRRLLCASYWCWRALLWWFADAVIAVLAPPEDGVIYFIGDGTFKEKTAKKHPLAKKGRLNSYSGYVFGLQLLIVMVGWKRYRLPIDFEIIRPKDNADHQTMNALFRQMIRRFVPPAWAKQVIVVADAAFPAKATLALIQQRGFFFVMRIARTWKFADGHSLKNWVTYLPKKHFKKAWFPQPDGRRRVYWVFSKCQCLRHLGDVTLVLSKKRRNDGPKATKILVTNLPEVQPRQVIAHYTRRWDVELLIKELKGVTGIGQAQVTKDPQRVERSVALSVMAYLLLIRFRYRDIPDQGPWSAFTLKRHLAWDIAQQQVEHSLLLKWRKAA